MSSPSKPIAVVTGATGTFGRHIAAGLVTAGFETICLGRDAEKGSALLKWLSSREPTSSASFEVVDCASQRSIVAFREKLRKAYPNRPISVLVNNAAVVPKVRQETAALDGSIEMQWACNVLGYHWMIKALLPLMRQTKPEGSSLGRAPRIVNVASRYAGAMDLKDPEFKRRKYDADAAYRQSKQADRMLTAAWASTLKQECIVVSCHPGVAASAVADGLGFSFDDSEAAAASGSVTPLFCALDDSVKSGAFYVDSRKTNCPFSQDAAACEALLHTLDSYVL